MTPSRPDRRPTAPTAAAARRPAAAFAGTFAGIALALAVAAFPAGPAAGDHHTGLPAGVPAAAAEAQQAIDAAALEATVRFLADDLLEGRGPATRGDELTRLWLATTMQLLGLEPAGTAGWEQPFGIVGITAAMPAEWSFSAGGETLSLARSEDYIAASGVQRERASIEGAEVVFVGYGIEAPEYGWDDFKGVDLTGKVLLMLNNDPDWDPELFAGKRRLYYGRWTYKYESAARQGAAGAIIVHTDPSAGYPWQVVQTSWSGEQFELPAGDEPRLEVTGWVTEDAASRLVKLGGHDLAALVDVGALARLPAGAARRAHLAHPGQRDLAGRDRQRRGPPARQRPGARRRGRGLHRPPRPPRDRRGGRGPRGRPDLQRRDRQRLRLRPARSAIARR